MDKLGLGSSPSAKGLHRRVLSTALEKGSSSSSPTRRKRSSAVEPATRFNEAREKLRKWTQSASRSLSSTYRSAGLVGLLLLLGAGFYWLRGSSGQPRVAQAGFKLPQVSLRRGRWDMHKYHPLKLPESPSRQNIRLLHVTQSFGPSLSNSGDDLLPDVLTSLAIKQQDSPLYNTSIIMPFYPAIKKKYNKLKKFAELNVPMENDLAVNFRVFLQRWNHTSFAETSGSSYTTMNVFLIEPGHRKPYKAPFKQRQSFALTLQDVYFAKASAELVTYLTSAEGTTLFDDIMSEDAQEDSTSSSHTVVHAHGSNCALFLPFLRHTLSQTRQSIQAPSIATVYSMHEDLSQELLTHFSLGTLKPFFPRKVLKLLTAHLELDAKPAIIFPSVMGVASADHVVLPSEQLGSELIRQTAHPNMKEAIMPDLLHLASEERYHGIDGSVSIARIQQVLCSRQDIASADCATDIYALKAAARSHLGIKHFFQPSSTVIIYHRLAANSLHAESFGNLMQELSKTDTSPYILLLSLSPKYNLPSSLESIINQHPQIKLLSDSDDALVALAASDLFLPDASLPYSTYTRQIETAAQLGIKELPLYTPLVHSPQVNMGDLYNPFEKVQEAPFAIDVGWANQTVHRVDVGKREQVTLPLARSAFDKYDAVYNLALAYREKLNSARPAADEDGSEDELSYFAAEEQEEEEEAARDQAFAIVQ